MPRVVARLLEFKWRILAISAVVVVASSIATFGYLSFKELPVQGQNEEQWNIANFGLDKPGKAYRVEIQSIDESAGTAHLKVDVLVPRREELMTAYMQLSGLTTFNSKTPMPPLSFRPLKVLSFTFDMLLDPEFTQRRAASGTPWARLTYSEDDPFRKFSEPLLPTGAALESRPQTVQSDVEIFGHPWWYPFDRYFLAAGLNCDVVLRDNKEQSHELEDQGYYISIQLPPNLIVERATKEDFNRVARSASTHPPNKLKSFDPDLWKRGLVVLMLHRPIFPRFFAIFFGVVAVIWICVIGMIAEKKQLTLNVVGYFLSIWAIRAPLAIGAPKVTTLMDYVTLGLYGILAAVAGFRLLWGYQKSSTS